MGDVVVMGYNPENADINNPRGEIYGMRAYTVAETETGSRVRLPICTEFDSSVAMAKAERVANALNARLKNLGKLPVAFDRWEDYYPAYGSPAHDESDLIEWENRLEEGGY
jgi:hypothetical protein